MSNEKRLIDANKVIKAMQKCLDESPDKKDSVAYFAFESIIECLKQEPTVDAVEVVRCEKCKHLNVLNREDIYAHCPKTNTIFLPFELDTRTHFCSCGAKMDGGAEHE